MIMECVAFTLLDRIDWLAALREAAYRADLEEWDFYYEWILDLFSDPLDIHVYDAADRVCPHPRWILHEMEHREVTAWSWEHRPAETCAECGAEYKWHDWVPCDCTTCRCHRGRCRC